MKILALLLAACTVRAVTSPRPLPRYGLNVCVKPCPVLASAEFVRALPWQDVELADCCVGMR
jgi:hypothetical protein